MKKIKTHKKRKNKSYLFPIFTLIFLGVVLLFILIQNTQRQNSKTHAQAEIDSEITPEATPTKGPGQIISLDLRVPGIGTKSANFDPVRKTRDVIIYLYKVDVNSADSSIKPLFKHKAELTFDGVVKSPTYGRFVNTNIEMGQETPDGKYQIVIKAYQALPKIVKVKENDVGGKVFEVNKGFNQIITLSNQKVITGDISPAPNGDNKINIDDYKALINCFGANADTASCKDKNIADLDDNGVIDGVDLNLFTNSIKILTALGYPTPILTEPTPTNSPTPTVKPTIQPTPVVNSQPTAKKRGGLGILLVLLLLIVLFPVLFLLYKKNKKFKSFVSPILHKIPFIPAESLAKTETVGAQSVQLSDELVDKDYFVKIQTFDDLKKKTVLTLTDDNGPTLGYFTGPYVTEGFARVKGVLKKEGSKEFVEVSEITAQSE